MTEALAWCVDHSLNFARAFALLFLEGDPTGANAFRTAGQIDARTRLALPSSDGTSTVFPDLSLCTEDRRAQLLVEVKVGADFHSFAAEDGELRLQPDHYLAEWRALGWQDVAVHRLGTLTRDPAMTSLSRPHRREKHPERAADVKWSAVRDLLAETVARGELAPIAEEFVLTLDRRVLHQPVVRDMSWAARARAERFLPDAMRALATRIGGTLRTPLLKRRSKEADVGGYIDLDVVGDGAPEALALWLYASPAGAAYSVWGVPDAVYLRVGGHDIGPRVARRIEQEFQIADIPAQWRAHRAWIALDEVMDSSDPAELIVDHFSDKLFRTGIAVRFSG